jgi:hypothetical protein
MLGKTSSLVEALTAKGKVFDAEITIDEAVNTPKFTFSLPSEYDMTPPAIEYVKRLQAIKKAEISLAGWDTGKLITLKEVTVTARDKNWYKRFDTQAKKIIGLDSLDPKGNRYKNLVDLLQQEFGAKTYFIKGTGIEAVLLPCERLCWKMISARGDPDPHSFSNAIKPCIVTFSDYWFPIIVINGSTYFNARSDSAMFGQLLNTLSSINANEIKRIMVLPPGNIPSYYADPEIRLWVKQSLVVLETYSDKTFRGDPTGIRIFTIDGPDVPRVFYSPRYEGAARYSPEYDGRATLYWEPSVKTNANGQAEIEFYTSDRKAAMAVIVNGIEAGTGESGQVQTLINPVPTH